MEEDIDVMYERYIDALIEEREEKERVTRNKSTAEHDWDRHEMWCMLLGPEYKRKKGSARTKMTKAFASKYGLWPKEIDWEWCHMHNVPSFSDFKLELEDIREMEFDMDICKPLECIIPATGAVNYITTMSGFNVPVSSIQLGNLSPCKTGAKPMPVQEKETNMGYEYNMEVDQRNHLKRRLDDVKNTKARDLRGKFHIGEAHPARTKDEILTALKNGEVKFIDYFFTNDVLSKGFEPDGTFSLKNPKEDTAGYESAEKLLGTAYTTTKDAIIVKSLTDGLTALNEFEAKEF